MRGFVGVELSRAGRRIWQRSPGISLLAAAAIAVASALLISIMSVIWGVFEADLPGVTEQGLLRVAVDDPAAGIERRPVSPDEYLWWQHQGIAGLGDIGAFIGTSTTLAGDGVAAVRLNGAYVTPSLLAMTGARPLHGGLFTDPQTPGAVLLGYGTWMRHFGGDPSLVGRTIELDSRKVSVVGIMPPEFRFPLNQDLWLPLVVDREALWQQASLQAIVRVGSSLSLERLRFELDAGLRELRGRGSNTPPRILVEPYVAAFSDSEFRGYLSIMAWAALGALFVAAVNVSCLLAGRAVARQPEISLRRALGARRRDLVWAPLGEALGLASVGCGAGLVLSLLLLDRVGAMLESHLLSYWISVGVDWRSVLLTVAAVGLCVSVSAALPVVGSLRGEDRTGAVATRSRRQLGRFLRVTLVVQLAISSGILFPTVALLQSLWTLSRYEPRLATDGVIRAQIALPWFGDRADLRQARFARDLLSELRARQGFEAAALASALPGDTPPRVRLVLAGRDGIEPEAASWQAVTPGFFETFRVELLAGRGFDGRDDLHSEPVVLLTESLATGLFGGAEAAVGRRVGLVGQAPNAAWSRIVGVVPDAVADSGIPTTETGFLPTIEARAETSSGAVFRPLSQVPSGWLSVVARTRLAPREGIASLRQSLRRVDSRVPLFWETSYDQLILGRTWDYRLFGKLFVVLGLFALLMTLIGLFGVANLLVRERTPEIAIRKAVGASRGAIRRMIFRFGALTVVVGLAIGHGIGYVGGKLLHSLFFQLDELGLEHVVAVDLILPLAASLALWLPARRAAAISPREALAGDQGRR